ncbi:MAG: tetratricopeptide repeat protein [Sedimentisphaeraceae bacterium JB056]
MSFESKDIPKCKRKKILYLFYLLFVAAVVCCIIAVIIGCIGVFRGYSVQSSIFLSLPLVLLLACFGMNRILVTNPNGVLKSINNKFFLPFITCCLLFSCFPGWNYRKGFKFYQEGNYAEATIEFEKETQYWYHKVTPNFSEPASMNELAKSYCQLEEFDKARSIYELSLDRYRGTVHGDLAEIRLAGLESGLKAISEYSDQNQKGYDEYDRLYMVASEYASLPCRNKAFEIYKTITEMNIPDEHKRIAYEEIQKTTLSKPSR